MQEQPLTKSNEDVHTNDSAGAAFNDQVPDANPELLHTSAEEDVVLEGELLTVSYPAEVVDALGKQI